MAFNKVILLLLASFLLFTIRASCRDEEFFTETTYAKAPSRAPVPTPTYAKAPVKPPAPPPTYAKAPVKQPPAPAPTYAKAPVKPPAPPPTHAKAPTPVLSPVPITECPRLCAGRCKLHSRPRQCNRICYTCCQRCKCVPPGTYGNRQMCGKCYTDMTTHGNQPKCP
ncbi:PREDICTED: gibberellin-regulated protein 14-like [Nelumbo nucifera]|uniref:Gibberellin-regulated protein 14-like n=1 Tax=Nelumbo nucifera TaxID=4432 RepID=A0A1U8AZ47_NELNU|nr:PREDICTED: gibberellin-regulated protein 14-like [Nelumbo nucifera]